MTFVVDHLIHAGPDLDRLVSDTTRVAGVAPTPGGSHPGQGTRNALLGLRGGSYLELMAPDPEGERGDFLASIEALHAPELHAWCVRTGDADACDAAIRASGLGVCRSAAGRDTPSGERLEWELLFPVDHPFGGLAPFFIDWRGSRHPTTALGVDLRLRTLALRHPRGEELRRWLDGLGVAGGAGAAGDGPRLEVAAGRGPALRADLVGRRGPFALRGSGAGMRIGGRAG